MQNLIRNGLLGLLAVIFILSSIAYADYKDAVPLLDYYIPNWTPVPTATPTVTPTPTNTPTVTQTPTPISLPDLSDVYSSMVPNHTQVLTYSGMLGWWYAATLSGLESDPVFSASDVADITNADQANWDTAHGWGDHASGGYLKADGSVALTVDWDIGDGRKIQADEIQARNGAGLLLTEDGGSGIFVEDGGEVGIGTAAPSQKLDVGFNTDVSVIAGRAHVGYVGWADYAGFSHVDQDSTTSYALMQDSNGSTLLNAASGQPIRFRINNSGADIMHISSTGFVGIGTVSPGVKLDIVSADDAVPIRLSDSIADNDQKDAFFTARSYDIDEQDMMMFWAATGFPSATENVLNYGGGSTLYNATTELRFWTATNATTLQGVQRMTIDNAGNVGIGTSSPDSVFHIKADFPGTIIGSDYAGQLIIQNPADTVWSNVVITAYESDGSGNPDQQLWYLGSSSVGNSDIIFLNRRNSKLALGTNDTTRITILGNGNVGIGETAPSAKLEILSTTTQLKLTHTADTDEATWTVNSDGDTTIISSGGDIDFSDENLSTTGTFQAADYYSGDGTQGITDTTSYWFCTTDTCTTSCQVSIKDGLIVGCP